MEIAEFLLARIAEDRDEVADLHHRYDCSTNSAAAIGGFPCDCPWPARLVADVDAKRRIVEIHKPWHGGYECPTCADGAGMDHGEVVVDRLRAPCPTLRALAAPYADHPDFDRAWSLAAKV